MMKLVIIFPLFLVIYINNNFAQDIKNSQTIDSIAIRTTVKSINNSLSAYGSIIDCNDFNKGAVISPMLLLQGKVPGFVVNCLNGNDPNPEIQIQTRGISTLFCSTNPLYIIDGIPMESIDIVAVENIESIEVLKSLSETALYGIRGSNGVVIIKTKKNSIKPFSVSYKTYMYGETYANKSNYMSASKWRTLKQDWSLSTDPELKYKSNKMIDYDRNTDWRKEISQNKLSQAHHLEFLGTHNKTSYSAMLNYSNYNGIIQKTGNTLYNGQISLSQLALKDKLQVDLTLITSSRNYSESNDNKYLKYSGLYTETKRVKQNIISYTNRYNPTVSVVNPYEVYDGIIYPVSNPRIDIDNTADHRKLNNTLIHVQASYEIVKGLKLSGSWSETKTASENIFSHYYQYYTNPYLSATKETNDHKERIVSTKLNYKKSIAFHHFDFSLDYSKQTNDFDYYRDSVRTFEGEEPSIRTRVTEYHGYKNLNLSGVIKYNYKHKYYLSAGILKETGGFCTPAEPVLYHPSLSIAWHLSNEEFLKNQNWLNELNIRAGYGESNRMLFLNSLGYTNVSVNPKFHGEKLKEYFVGFDMGFLSNRLGFSVDYYNRETKDVVVISTIPSTTGYSTQILNEPEIQNKGCEFYIKAQPLINKLKWTFDFNISYNQNIINSEYDQTWNNTSFNDQPVGNFVGYQFAGYSNSNTVLVFDNDRNASEPDTDYEQILGNGVPKSFFGFTNTFAYRNLDLSIFLRGALGFEIYNLNSCESTRYDNFHKSTLTDDQRNIVNYYSLQSTDYFIEKGDYLKVNYISLGYTIPFENRTINSIKFYMTCNNVALLTKATNANPESAGINGLYPGYYNYERYPQTRKFLLGLNVLF